LVGPEPADQTVAKLDPFFGCHGILTRKQHAIQTGLEWGDLGAMDGSSDSIVRGNGAFQVS
jgi:hypothetical protein